MRRSVLAGLGLALTAGCLVALGAALDLELQPVALLGLAIGAVVALVADRSVGYRLSGLVAGVAAAWLGYLVRAQFLPDTEAGRAVFATLVVVLATGLVAASRDRLPLWSVLLGSAAFAGAFEAAYAAAPALVVSTSMSAATPLLFAIAAGFLAATVVAPAPSAPSVTLARTPEREPVAVGR